MICTQCKKKISDTKNYCVELKANEQRLNVQIQTMQEFLAKESQVIENSSNSKNSQEPQIKQQNFEIPFIDPSNPEIPIEIKKEEGTLQITEVHESYGEIQSKKDPPNDPSSDEWPEEAVPDPPKKKRKPDTRKNRIRRPKGAPPIVRQSKYPELDREIENLPYTESGKVNCSKCSKEVFKKYYRQHMERIHYKVKNFICDKCGRKFYKCSEIEDHMNKHLGIKPYSCSYECGMSFSIKASLKKHIQSRHTEGAEFICEICALKFKEKKYLKVR